MGLGPLRDAYGCAVATRSDLERAVSSAFAGLHAIFLTGRIRTPTARPPLDEEYSRLLDAAKWRIVPARAEAWSEAAVEVGIATLERDIAVRWAKKSRVPHRRIDRLVPHVPGALPLVLAYTAFGG